MKMHLSEFSAIVGGELRGDDVTFERLSIDTRALNPGDVYLAIRGARFDGNDFVAQATAGALRRWSNTGRIMICRRCGLKTANAPDDLRRPGAIDGWPLGRYHQQR